MQLKIYSDIPSAFRRDWIKLWRRYPEADFFNHPDWTLACRLARPEDPLFIFAIYTGKQLIAVLPLVKSKKFGIPVFCCPGGDYLDKTSLLAPLNHPKTIRFLLHSVLQQASLYLAEVTSPLQFPGIITVPRPLSTSPYLSLASDPFRYLNRHHRKEIMSAINKIPGRLEYRFISPVSLSDLDSVIQLERRSTKIRRSMAMFARPAALRLVSGIVSASPERLAVAVLLLDSQPIAADMGYLTGSVFHNFYTVYDQKFAAYSPGRVLKYKLIEYLSHHGYTEINFSRGPSRYKRDFSPDIVLHYDQLISRKQLINFYWRIVNVFFLFLERHPRYYQAVRGVKNHILGWKIWLYLKLLIRTPSAFLFNFLSRDSRPVSIRPFDPRSRLVAARLIGRINAVSPDLKAHLIGSTLFGIAGNGDIDIFIESEFPSAAAFMSKLSLLLGPPVKMRDRFVEWKTSVDGIPTEVTLIDSRNSRFKEQMKIKDTLVNNPVLMNEYLSLKQTLSGRTNRDYQLMRMDFFNRILKLK